MAKSAVSHAASAATEQLAAPLPPILKWSISDAWTWLGHAWKTLIHLPYLGLVALVLAALLLARALHKALV